MTLSRWYRRWVLVAWPACFSGACVARESVAKEIENRLIAPCCFAQSLVAHDSPIARELRREVEERVGRGDPGSSIEDDLARRFGERVRAVPRGADPFAALPVVLGLAMGAAAIVVVRLGRRASRPKTAETSDGSVAELDRLDDELDRLS